MRVMLVSNIAVENRFANGTQGRLMNWYPEKASDDGRKALLSSHPDLMARFVKETSLNKQEFHPDIDFMDITARQENPREGPAAVVPAFLITRCLATIRT